MADPITTNVPDPKAAPVAQDQVIIAPLSTAPQPELEQYLFRLLKKDGAVPKALELEMNSFGKDKGVGPLMTLGAEYLSRTNEIASISKGDYLVALLGVGGMEKIKQELRSEISAYQKDGTIGPLLGTAETQLHKSATAAINSAEGISDRYQMLLKKAQESPSTEPTTPAEDFTKKMADVERKTAEIFADSSLSDAEKMAALTKLGREIKPIYEQSAKTNLDPITAQVEQAAAEAGKLLFQQYEEALRQLSGKILNKGLSFPAKPNNSSSSASPEAPAR